VIGEDDKAIFSIPGDTQILISSSHSLLNKLNALNFQFHLLQPSFVVVSQNPWVPAIPLSPPAPALVWHSCVEEIYTVIYLYLRMFFLSKNV
jgi:hypothetical protein